MFVPQISSNPTYKDIDSWLATRKLLTDISDQYINDNDTFVENIIALTFGNWKQLIYHLINTVNLKQRNVIQNILKEEKYKYDEIITNDNIHEQNILTPTSYFDQLSTTSITNICAYLDMNDIYQFKLTCNSIAVQCFLEMKKYGNIGVLNLSILDTQYKYLSLFQSINRRRAIDVFTFDRYTKSIMQDPFLYLESWSNTYNIPQNRLLLSCTNFSAFYDDWISGHKFCVLHDTENPRLHARRLVLIFDKQKINDISKQISIKNDTDDHEIDPFIESDDISVIVYYFNIEQQYVEYNQTLIVNYDTTKTILSLFIKNNLNMFVPQISTNDINLTETLEKGVEVLSEMACRGCVVVFAATDEEYIQQCKNNWESQLESNVIFYDDPWDLSRDIIHKLQIKKQFVNKDKIESKLFSILRPQILYNILSFLSWNNIRIFCLLSVSFAIITAKHLRQEYEEIQQGIAEEKRLIGERLCPKIQAIEPDLAPKITEMLLELDNSELFELLEDNDQLMSIIKKAKQVLKDHQQKGSYQGYYSYHDSYPSSASIYRYNDDDDI